MALETGPKQQKRGMVQEESDLVASANEKIKAGSFTLELDEILAWVAAKEEEGHAKGAWNPVAKKPDLDPAPFVKAIENALCQLVQKLKEAESYIEDLTEAHKFTHTTMMCMAKVAGAKCAQRIDLQDLPHGMYSAADDLMKLAFFDLKKGNVNELHGMLENVQLEMRKWFKQASDEQEESSEDGSPEVMNDASESNAL